MVAGDIILLILSLLIFVLALGVLFSKSPINSAMCLVGVMVFLGVIYALIGAHFIAALQIIVYAGAVMVLFIFSIMLLNLTDPRSELNWSKVGTYLSFLSFVALVFMLSIAFLDSTPSFLGHDSAESVAQAGGNVQALSGLLFSKYYLHFEILSLVILAAIPGAIVIGKRKLD
jgi:NADH-quinone oxidoreductase subunit J